MITEKERTKLKLKEVNQQAVPQTEGKSTLILLGLLLGGAALVTATQIEAEPDKVDDLLDKKTPKFINDNFTCHLDFPDDCIKATLTNLKTKKVQNIKITNEAPGVLPRPYPNTRPDCQFLCFTVGDRKTKVYIALSDHPEWTYSVWGAEHVAKAYLRVWLDISEEETKDLIDLILENKNHLEPTQKESTPTALNMAELKIHHPEAAEFLNKEHRWEQDHGVYKYFVKGNTLYLYWIHKGVRIGDYQVDEYTKPLTVINKKHFYDEPWHETKKTFWFKQNAARQILVSNRSDFKNDYFKLDSSMGPDFTPEDIAETFNIGDLDQDLLESLLVELEKDKEKYK